MYIETFAEFKERMGCECFYVKQRYLFRNGGQSNGTLHLDPPADENSCLSLQREFLQFKHDSLVKQFNSIKQDAMNQASLSYKYKNLPTPDANAPKLLKHLQGIITRIRAKLAAIDAQLGRCSPAIREQNQHDTRASEQARITSILAQVQDIEI